VAQVGEVVSYAADGSVVGDFAAREKHELVEEFEGGC
jgi:hypothetical protein